MSIEKNVLATMEILNIKMQNDILKIKMFHKSSVKFMCRMLCAHSSVFIVSPAFSKILCVLCGVSMGWVGHFCILICNFAF